MYLYFFKRIFFKQPKPNPQDINPNPTRDRRKKFQPASAGWVNPNGLTLPVHGSNGHHHHHLVFSFSRETTILPQMICGMLLLHGILFGILRLERQDKALLYLYLLLYLLVSELCHQSFTYSIIFIGAKVTLFCHFVCI